MKLKELQERIGWQIEGRLQWKDLSGGWNDWIDSTGTPEISDSADHYRRRQDTQPMPDTMWIAEYPGLVPHIMPVAYRNKEDCAYQNHSATPIRYVRADRVFRLTDVECKSYSGAWIPCMDTGTEYRLKP